MRSVSYDLIAQSTVVSSTNWKEKKEPLNLNLKQLIIN